MREGWAVSEMVGWLRWMRGVASGVQGTRRAYRGSSGWLLR